MDVTDGRNLVQVAERFRMQPPVAAPSKRYHESREVSQLLSSDIHTSIFSRGHGDDVRLNAEEACTKDLEALLNSTTRGDQGGDTASKEQGTPGTRQSIYDALGRVFAEHVTRSEGDQVDERLAREASQALMAMATVAGSPVSGGSFPSSRHYIIALGALIRCYEKRRVIDVDTALHYFYDNA